MKRLFIIVLALSSIMRPIAAQQNWAAIPCSKMSAVAAINKMFVDSLHNEIILESFNGYKVCNTTFKGIFAYNGSGFHDLDKGIDTHDPNLTSSGVPVNGCITYGNKTLFGGGFNSVGSNTLYTKSLAVWNGAIWDTFPKHCFNNGLNGSGGGFQGFLKYQGKLWMYGGFDTIGNTITKNLTAFDGNTFTAVPAIPVNNNAPIVKMIVYKNKLIAGGGFYDYPSNSISMLAQYDGTNWATVGNGIQGGLSNICDMAVYKDTLYIAGAFPKSAGNVGNNLMKWDGTQLHDAGFGGFCGYGAIWSLVPYRNRLYAFGGFGCAAGQKAFGMAYYENGTWTVSQDSVDNLITSAVLYNDAIYIGGGFKSINGDTTIQKFAKLMCPDFDAANLCLSGIEKNELNKLNIKVFPNPVIDKLHLEYENKIDIDKISITNTLGQEVLMIMNPKAKQEVDISQLPAGIYFLKAENKQGQRVFKMVKE
jgi:hypothetical protein